MQQTFKSNGGFRAKTAASTSSAQAVPAVATERKKTSGEVVFRVKRKGKDGEINSNGQPTKWVTVGNLYRNTDLETGDVYYSFQAKEDIGAGLHKAFDAAAPVGTSN